MALEGWLPIGYALPDGAKCGRALRGSSNWQIVETEGEGRALVVREDLASAWIQGGLLDESEMPGFAFGAEKFREIASSADRMLAPVADCRTPNSKSEAIAFAAALRVTREIDPQSPLQDAIYVEKFSRLLPTYGITPRMGDDVVLGYWLTGGANVSARSSRRLRQMLTWLEGGQLADVLRAAGIESDAVPSSDGSQRRNSEGDVAKGDGRSPQPESSTLSEGKKFSLPGRPGLEAFFNEHVVDIIRNRERYKALGVDFPSAIALHGPPGCGKTFAVERLVEFLGWPSYQIDASSVASPYIHETSRKVAAVFEKAIETAPSVLIIDEMEAFLADREMGSGSSHHRVEEVAEFLRRIPEAAKRDVLIIGMTNRIEMIDPAIMRRGRFDHVIKVDYASEDEVHSLLAKLLSDLPKDETVDVASLARSLAGRPLSDVTFVVREGCRLAARAGGRRVGQLFLREALESAPSRSSEESGRRIGFY